MTRARLDRLAALAHRALSAPPQDHARLERTIQLICRALQTSVWVHQRIGTAEHQRQTAEIMALRRWIVERARIAGLRIMDDDIVSGADELGVLPPDEDLHLLVRLLPVPLRHAHHVVDVVHREQLGALGDELRRAATALGLRDEVVDHPSGVGLDPVVDPAHYGEGVGIGLVARAIAIIDE